MSAALGPAAEPDRGSALLPVVDDIKTAAIVAVVLQHALPPFWVSTSPWESALSALIQFHVPAFLMVSGFLTWQPRGLASADIVRRLRRVLPPYLVASCVWWVVGAGAWQGPGVSLGWMLATGSVVPIYYYVFLLVVCFVAMWPLSRASVRVQTAVFAGALLWQVWQTIDPTFRWSLGLFWAIRNPLEYFHYFLAGWLVAGVGARRAPEVPAALVAASVVVVVAYFGWLAAMPDALGLGGPALRTVYSFAVVALLCALSAAGRHLPLAWFAGPASYTLFLYHFPVATKLDSLTASWPHPASVSLKFVGALAAGALVVVVGRRLFGARARDLIGC